MLNNHKYLKWIQMRKYISSFVYAYIYDLRIGLLVKLKGPL